MTEETTEEKKWLKHRLVFEGQLFKEIHIVMKPSVEFSVRVSPPEVDKRQYSHETFHIYRDFEKDEYMNRERELYFAFSEAEKEFYPYPSHETTSTKEDGQCTEISVYVKNNVLNIVETLFDYDKGYSSSLGDGIKRDNLKVISHIVFPLHRIERIETGTNLPTKTEKDTSMSDSTD
jgi:hypothetical protein